MSDESTALDTRAGSTEISATILDKVCHVVSDVLGVPLAEVHAHSIPFELGADSFHFLDIVCRLESEFRIVLPSTLAMPNRRPVRVIAGAVSMALAARPAPPAQDVPRCGSLRLLWG